MTEMTNFLDVPEQYRNKETAKIAIFPFGLELTTSYMTGTARGPEKLIEASGQVEFFDFELQSEPYLEGIYTAPPLPTEGKVEGILANAQKEIRQSFEKGQFPVTLGGEHTISAAPVRAAVEVHGDISVLHFDAHSDMRDTFEGSPYSHACAMRRIHEVVGHTYSVGIRAQCKEEAAYIKENKHRYGVQYDDQRALHGLNAQEALKYLPTEKVYITVDLDYFSPMEMPSVGTPVPGGGFWYETLQFLRKIYEAKTIIGCDVVELKPDQNIRSDFFAAQLVYKLISYRQLMP